MQRWNHVRLCCAFFRHCSHKRVVVARSKTLPLAQAAMRMVHVISRNNCIPSDHAAALEYVISRNNRIPSDHSAALEWHAMIEWQ
jgi:hypothetical protein